MRPTSEQIQHAAYERWLRRGYSHGRDRDDWLAAEKELTFLLNYRTIAEYSLDSGDRSVVGKASSPRCRFCERASGQFKSGPRPSRRTGWHRQRAPVHHRDLRGLSGRVA